MKPAHILVCALAAVVIDPVVRFVRAVKNIGAAGNAIVAGVPTADIAKRLDRGLFPTTALFRKAAQAGRTDVLALLFNAARPKGQAVIDAGAHAVLSSRLAFNDIDMARVALAHSTPDVLNRPSKEWISPPGVVAVWFDAFYGATLTPHDLDTLMALLREHGADLARSPRIDLTRTDGGAHYEAFRASLIAERVEHERAVLAQAVEEAHTEPTTTRRRL
ncbi:hypothetical protein [Paraburkholderia tropica]|uniref:hypothetical protein n=1 Tax=Paraburkholderia tropica TaxID=92647 RepID=UPI0031D0A71E